MAPPLDESVVLLASPLDVPPVAVMLPPPPPLEVGATSPLPELEGPPLVPVPSEFADAENDSDSAGSPHDMTNMASTHDDATADPLEGKASRIAPR